MEIIDALEASNAEAELVYIPMSIQPVLGKCELIGVDGICDKTGAFGEDGRLYVSENSIDTWKRCLCLPLI